MQYSQEIGTWFGKRSKFAILAVSLFLSVSVAVTTTEIATLRFALLEGYHPMLNKVCKPYRFKRLKNRVFYNPLAIFYWQDKFYRYAKKDFNRFLPLAYGGMAGGILILLIGGFIAKSKKKQLTSHGSGRWATEGELEATGLTKPEGVMLGVTQGGRYIRHNGPEHIGVYAPTRSGKGVGIIIPTLLAWLESVLVIDIKGENYAITAGFRKWVLKQKIFKFDPTTWDSPDAAHFNPLEEIRVGTPSEVKDTQRIVNMIIDTEGKPQDHWTRTASALLMGLILYVLYCEEDKTMSRVADIINNPGQDVEDVAASLRLLAEQQHSTPELMKKLYGETNPTGKHPKIWHALTEAANKPDSERGSVISTVVANLALYRDPIIRQNIGKSDFKIADLMNHESPVSLYIVIPPSDIDRVTPLTRIIINQIVSTLTEKMEFENARPIKGYKHRLLLLLDEFPALGRIDSLERAFAFIAGYGLKALIIIQDLKQMNKTYTKDNTVFANCHIQVAYAPNELETQEHISKSLGDMTIMVDSFSYDKGIRSIFGARKSGKSAHARRLMTPDEVKRMPPSDEIVFVTGVAPYKAKKIVYYEDQNFTKRLLPPPETSDCLTGARNPAGPPQAPPTEILTTISDNLQRINFNQPADKLSPEALELLQCLSTTEEIEKMLDDENAFLEPPETFDDLDAQTAAADDLSPYLNVV